MTVDTSRPAVEALIAEFRDGYLTGVGELPAKAADTLTALLDERDAARDSSVWRDTIDEQRAYIRDLEATVDNLRLISNANGDWNIKYQEVNHRAERAEAERDGAIKAMNDHRCDAQAERAYHRALAAEADVARLTAFWHASEDECRAVQARLDSLTAIVQQVREVNEAAHTQEHAVPDWAIDAEARRSQILTRLGNRLDAILDTTEPEEGQ